MSGVARPQTYISLHNIRSYRNVSMIENMYTSNKIDVYKGVLSVNARKGKSICEFAQHGFIYVHEYLCYDICIFLSMCLYTKSFKCGLAREETYVSSQNLSSYTKYLSYDTCIFANIFMYTKRFKV